MKGSKMTPPPRMMYVLGGDIAGSSKSQSGTVGAEAHASNSTQRPEQQVEAEMGGGRKSKQRTLMGSAKSELRHKYTRSKGKVKPSCSGESDLN